MLFISGYWGCVLYVVLVMRSGCTWEYVYFLSLVVFFLNEVSLVFVGSCYILVFFFLLFWLLILLIVFADSRWLFLVIVNVVGGVCGWLTIISYYLVFF